MGHPQPGQYARAQPCSRSSVAPRVGTESADFDLPTLALDGLGEEQSRARLAQAEAKLSLAVLGVRPPRARRPHRRAVRAAQLYLDRTPLLRVPAVLQNVAGSEDPAARCAVHPKHPQFEKLRQKPISPCAARGDRARSRSRPAPALKPGQKHDIALVRQRLGANTADGADATIYDEALVASVKAFQADKGLAKAGGTITAGTRAALNASDTGKVRKLLANMEQWRWMPADLGDLYVWVNIPEFRCASSRTAR